MASNLTCSIFASSQATALISKGGLTGATSPWSGLSPGSVLEALSVLLLSGGIVTANLALVLVINSSSYAKYIHQQPRYLLTSLASNDLAIGLLVTPLGVLPALLGCWPFSNTLCQIQALLRAALTQQNAAILVCMSVDRYTCMIHPDSYHRHSVTKGCMAVLSLTLVVSLSLYSTVVLQRDGYKFSLYSGLGACEPSYPRASIRILAACVFYFPTTMLLMYCYGSAFHASKLRVRSSHQAKSTASREERAVSAQASRTMAAISLGFIVMVTPWTINEVVVACTNTKMPESLEFAVTWLAMSNSFWNPFLYWLLNAHFRRITKQLFLTKVLCRGGGEKKGRPGECCPTPAGGMMSGPLARDIEEKYWGEILERAVSVTSLKVPPLPPPPPPPPPRRVV